jgi:hypothetical protein
MITQRKQNKSFQRRILSLLLISLGLALPIINTNAQEQQVDFNFLTAEQMANLSLLAVSSMTADQIAAIPPDAFLGMTAEQMAQINPEPFKQMPSEVVSKVFTNVDPKNITPIDAQRLVPDDWTLDLSSGTLIAPPEAKLTLTVLPIEDTELLVDSPELPDLNAGFGIGGRGIPVVTRITDAFNVMVGLQDFTLLQDDTGIFELKATGDNVVNNELNFIPDFDNINQIQDERFAFGIGDFLDLTGPVSVDDGGFYRFTTPEGLQIRIIPAPKNLEMLSEALGGGQVILGQDGDVFMEYLNDPSGETTYHIVIFDYKVELETTGLAPGLYVDETGSGKVVYSDGTFQLTKQTVYSPTTFIQVGSEFPGVKPNSFLYKVDGTFEVSVKSETIETSTIQVGNDDDTFTETTVTVYQTQRYILEPLHGEVVEDLAGGESLESSVVLGDDEILNYTTWIEGDTKVSTRKRGKPRKVKSQLKARR